MQLDACFFFPFLPPGRWPEGEVWQEAHSGGRPFTAAVYSTAVKGALSAHRRGVSINRCDRFSQRSIFLERQG